jgi:hypothetical protein
MLNKLFGQRAFILTLYYSLAFRTLLCACAGGLLLALPEKSRVIDHRFTAGRQVFAAGTNGNLLKRSPCIAGCQPFILGNR